MAIDTKPTEISFLVRQKSSQHCQHMCKHKESVHLPVLQFFAIDTHGPLVALSNADLMATALDILARVLGGVHGCKHKTTLKIQRCQSKLSCFALILDFCDLQQKNIELPSVFYSVYLFFWQRAFVQQIYSKKKRKAAIFLCQFCYIYTI